MSDSFDCPKCGAPLQYDGEKEGYKETITCPYCGESVIVPENLRTHAPQMINVGEASHAAVIELGGLAQPTVITLDTEAPAQAAQAAKRSIGGCLVISLIIVVIMGVVAIFSMNSIKNAVLSAFNLSQNRPASDAQTQIAPILAQAIMTATEPPTEVPTAADTETPTPSINITATAQAAATLTALNDLADQQSNWPVVVQEKFVNDALNWNVGSDNNQYAIENFTIAANKYTWKFTTKKSMGSFSFPDMQNLTDMFVGVDMQMVSSGTYNDDEAGIIFHVSNKDNTFYFFGVNPNGFYWLSMYDGSNWNDMIPATPSDLLKPNQVNHLAVSIQGNEILLMINNSVVNSFEDAQLSSGGAGLGVELTSAGEDATVIFSNFYLRAPKQ
ncbi:MAG: hypothetical protein ABSE06_01925 [Anaerolineaceae bacterium]